MSRRHYNKMLKLENKAMNEMYKDGSPWKLHDEHLLKYAESKPLWVKFVRKRGQSTM